MQIIIDDKKINLLPRDVKVAKDITIHCLNKAKEIAEETDAGAFYYTLLIVMHTISAELIEQYTPQLLSEILNSTFQKELEKEKKE